MFYDENQFWRVRRFLYQALDGKRKVEILKRRIEMRDVSNYDYEQLLDDLAQEKEAQKQAEIKVTDFISTLPDVNQQMVVIKKYVDGKSWEEISDEMVMSVRYVQKLHGKAMPLLKEEFDLEYPDEDE